LIGNFGDGVINIFEPEGHGEFEHEGSLHRVNGNPIVIQGLWALQFGNDGPAGPSSTLFFTAGPAGETHGLFGSIEAQSLRSNAASGTGAGRRPGTVRVLASTLSA